MGIESLAPMIVGPTGSSGGITTTTTITYTQRPSGTQVTGISALKCPTEYLGSQLGGGPNEYTANMVTYFIMAEDLPNVTPNEHDQITDNSVAHQVKLANKFPFLDRGTDKSFYQINVKKGPG